MWAETEAEDLHNVKGLDEEDPLAEDMEDLEVSEGEEEVLHSREWICENFHLNDNPIMIQNPNTKEALIKVLQRHGQALEGMAHHCQTVAQGVAGRTDWVIARVELIDGQS